MQKTLPCRMCGGQKVKGKGLYFCLRCLQKQVYRLLLEIMIIDAAKERGYWGQQPPVSKEEQGR